VEIDPKTIEGIALTITLIIPGYLSYSLKEMWISCREKTQFEKLLNSLVYSSFIWVVIFTFFDKFPKEYFQENSYGNFIGWIATLFISVFSVSLIMAYLEKNKYLYKIGKGLKITTKIGQNVPLLEDILCGITTLGSIEVITQDGSIYRGLNKKGQKILLGSHPHSGDVSFVCNYYKDSRGNITEYEDKNLAVNGFVMRTHISKDNIKSMRFTIK
jgi:hypothetical protein